MDGFLGAALGGMIPVPAYPPEPSRIERGLAPELERLRWIATDELSPDLAHAWKQPARGPDEVAFLQYTSGSTGDPKGVVVTQQNLMENLRGSTEYLAFGEPVRMVSWLPPYHDMGLIGGLLLPLFTGGECTFFSPLDFLADPHREAPLEACGVGRVHRHGDRAAHLRTQKCDEEIEPRRVHEEHSVAWLYCRLNRRADCARSLGEF